MQQRSPSPWRCWLWSRASHRGWYSRGFSSLYVNPGGDLAPADEMLSEWVQGAQLRELVTYPFRRRQHINLLEVHARKTGAIPAAKSRTTWRMRHVRLLESSAFYQLVVAGRRLVS